MVFNGVVADGTTSNNQVTALLCCGSEIGNNKMVLDSQGLGRPPRRPVACNSGLRFLNFPALWVQVACYLGQLGFSGRGWGSDEFGSGLRFGKTNSEQKFGIGFRGLGFRGLGV